MSWQKEIRRNTVQKLLCSNCILVSATETSQLKTRLFRCKNSCWREFVKLTWNKPHCGSYLKRLFSQTVPGRQPHGGCKHAPDILWVMYPRYYESKIFSLSTLERRPDLFAARPCPSVPCVDSAEHICKDSCAVSLFLSTHQSAGRRGLIISETAYMKHRHGND